MLGTLKEAVQASTPRIPSSTISIPLLNITSMCLKISFRQDHLKIAFSFQMHHLLYSKPGLVFWHKGDYSSVFKVSQVCGPAALEPMPQSFLSPQRHHQGLCGAPLLLGRIQNLPPWFLQCSSVFVLSFLSSNLQLLARITKDCLFSFVSPIFPDLKFSGMGWRQTAVASSESPGQCCTQEKALDEHLSATPCYLQETRWSRLERPKPLCSSSLTLIWRLADNSSPYLALPLQGCRRIKLEYYKYNPSKYLVRT